MIPKPKRIPKGCKRAYYTARQKAAIIEYFADLQRRRNMAAPRPGVVEAADGDLRKSDTPAAGLNRLQRP
jgi:hypothetical protein